MKVWIYLIFLCCLSMFAYASDYLHPLTYSIADLRYCHFDGTNCVTNITTNISIINNISSQTYNYTYIYNYTMITNISNISITNQSYVYNFTYTYNYSIINNVTNTTINNQTYIYNYTMIENITNTTINNNTYIYNYSIINNLTTLSAGDINITGNLSVAGNLSATWLFGKLNWSWLQDLPSYVKDWLPIMNELITDINSTASTKLNNNSNINVIILNTSQACIGDVCINAWSEVNLTGTGNTTQEIWDNVINDSFIFHYNTSWITANQNHLYNTSAEIFKNIANGSFLYHYNATWSKNGSAVNYSLICIGAVCIDAWSDVNVTGSSSTNGTDIWMNNLNVTLGFSLGNKTIYSFDQINLTGGSGTDTYNETQELWTNLINGSFIMHYNTTWIKANQNYWNSTDILGSKFCIGTNCISSWDSVNVSQTNYDNATIIRKYNTSWVSGIVTQAFVQGLSFFTEDETNTLLSDINQSMPANGTCASGYVMQGNQHSGISCVINGGGTGWANATSTNPIAIAVTEIHNPLNETYTFYTNDGYENFQAAP